MSVKAETEELALSLSPSDRVKLAENLIASLSTPFRSYEAMRFLSHIRTPV